jgi:hypothetical protein
VRSFSKALAADQLGRPRHQSTPMSASVAPVPVGVAPVSLARCDPRRFWHVSQPSSICFCRISTLASHGRSVPRGITDFPVVVLSSAVRGITESSPWYQGICASKRMKACRGTQRHQDHQDRHHGPPAVSGAPNGDRHQPDRRDAGAGTHRSRHPRRPCASESDGGGRARHPADLADRGRRRLVEDFGPLTRPVKLSGRR